ncbi:hypothetical protein C491_13537 [Natronococcus amylolyticus DSM 10524]|uniref:Uncharacterized protein n=1 Tax=Natronococcus amylolyticus DSM 10524 TaxID=1227497 RepID=L9X2Z4_9EURY|nr:hypothetical protein C491_13537 [Natronococcus amylolyticus DSM 10524]
MSSKFEITCSVAMLLRIYSMGRPGGKMGEWSFEARHITDFQLSHACMIYMTIWVYRSRLVNSGRLSMLTNVPEHVV